MIHNVRCDSCDELHFLTTEEYDLLDDEDEFICDACFKTGDFKEPVTAEPCDCGPSYGFFPGGDPNNFTPDPECCTEEEYQQWKEDCKKNMEQESAHVYGPGYHATVSKYGLGTYMYICPKHRSQDANN